MVLDDMVVGLGDDFATFFDESMAGKNVLLSTISHRQRQNTKLDSKI